ncbi:hypothetical protein G3O06_07650 [Burkholderia sp. Ac-20345]|uniref:hypothetical protein n=1 Tax=Burkholderia sp. Ac-20345 TaxID=2703891 RepID=UPI00197BCD3C|nr:hypothetical protein [Burkholderia sp. Ac-20345]MBN3777424.1 hypothetical protein [Burkholderia sp. Ac-20345]
MSISIEDRFDMTLNSPGSLYAIDTAAVAAVLTFERIHEQLHRRQSVEPQYIAEVAAQLAAGVMAGSGKENI